MELKARVASVEEDKVTYCDDPNRVAKRSTRVLLVVEGQHADVLVEGDEVTLVLPDEEKTKKE